MSTIEFAKGPLKSMDSYSNVCVALVKVSGIGLVLKGPEQKFRSAHSAETPYLLYSMFKPFIAFLCYTTPKNHLIWPFFIARPRKSSSYPMY